MRFHKSQKATIEQRFWAKVAIGDAADCWPWQATTDQRGYGMFAIGKREGRVSHMMRAHRYALELQIGRPLTPDEESCHSCDNTRCCNPSHLFVGSHDDNMKDMASKGRVAGEKHSQVKISDLGVLEAMNMRAAGLKIREIAAILGVSEGHASKLARGKRRS